VGPPDRRGFEKLSAAARVCDDELLQLRADLAELQRLSVADSNSSVTAETPTCGPSVLEVGFQDPSGIQRWRTVRGGIMAARERRDDIALSLRSRRHGDAGLSIAVRRGG
jgi:hypothetical protein